MRILLTSVFKPFAVDDEFGSRSINPAELYHNQVTREQGPFSLRMFHRSWGLMLLQHNIAAPCTVLDFPTRERFIEEITTREYDMIGISGIVVNVGKVREMCRLVRLHAPKAIVVVGGHVTAIPGVEQLVDADHIVRGEGVRWLREFVGEDPAAPVRQPPIPSSFGFHLMGMPASSGANAATIVPSVGCPLGCNFCTTSAFFGGKGRMVRFLESGREVFDVMCQAERELGVTNFFVMDENFLLYRKRALELLALMKAEGKAWALYVFSSANAIRKYEMAELVDLGIEWIWLGLESSGAGYTKLDGTDTLALTRELQAHGICVLGSTIIGMEHHTPENIDAHIAHAVAHDAVFHQFMLYTPMPGTALHREMRDAGRLLEGVELADTHGQFGFNFTHATIDGRDAKRFLDRAFEADYAVNGPSLYRLTRTMFDRWKRYHGSADGRLRARMADEARQMRRGYGAALWAMERYLRKSNATVSQRIRSLRLEMERELGGFTRAIDWTIGPILLWSAQREARRFPRGRPLEPRTFVSRRAGVSRPIEDHRAAGPARLAAPAAAQLHPRARPAIL
jgi:radical SAM superfamily enzyme YgiQ (UPF0313 family)